MRTASPNLNTAFVRGWQRRQFGQWWGAIIALLVSPPALGLTGILLGAVFLRRVQQSIPDVVPLVMPLAWAGRNPEDARHVPDLLRAPYDFIGTPTGERLLARSLSEIRCETSSWQVCGEPDGSQMSIVVRDKTTGRRRPVRLFSAHELNQRERELDLRTGYATHIPSAVIAVEKENVAGLPALVIDFPEGQSPIPETTFHARDVARYQLDWELECSQSDDLQGRLTGFEIPDPKEFLLPLLLTASRIKGPHTANVRTLILRFDSLRDRYLDGPRVLSVGSSISQANLLALEGGGVEVIDYSRWAVRLLGTEWKTGPTANLLAAGGRIEQELGEKEIASAQVRSLSSALFQHLRRKKENRSLE